MAAWLDARAQQRACLQALHDQYLRSRQALALAREEEIERLGDALCAAARPVRQHGSEMLARLARAESDARARYIRGCADAAQALLSGF